MSRFVAAVLVLIVGWLGCASLSAAADDTRASVHTYAYDSHHAAARLASTVTERGPPASYDLLFTSSATADRWSRGASVRPKTPSTLSSVAVDDPAALVLGVQATGTTWEQSPPSDGAFGAFDGRRVAANAGPRALPIGPWGQKIVDARTSLPSSWGPGTPNAKGVGTRWFDPANKGNGIRIDQGIPGSSFPSQQIDHVVVRSGGRVLGPDGKPIVGSLSQNPQAHIPLSDWLTWSSWSTP